MKAFQLQQQGDGGAPLVEADLPVPTPSEYEVGVAVRAAGVTPSELRWYPSTHQKDGRQRDGAVPGHEFSGVVTAVGRLVSELQVRDEIFGMSDWFLDGATAEFCVASENSLIKKPSSIAHELAAAIPISALTAWQGLMERAKVQCGERVLIVGASGSVGLMAVQIAALQGAIVFGSAAASAEPELKALGCQTVLDYRTQPFEQHVQGIDVVFDTVGGDTLARAATTLAPHGRMVTIAADAEGNEDPVIKAAFLLVQASKQQLQQIVELIQAGTLRSFVKAVLPFEKAPQAYSGRFQVPGLGKLVLAMPGS